MMRRVAVLLVVLGGGAVSGGCPEDPDNLVRLAVDPARVAATCAAYTACTNHLIPFGACYIIVDSSRYWSTTANSFEIGTKEDETWINTLTGLQNSVCMSEIEGGTCDEVLACANQGKIVRGCTPKEDHHAGRYCVDSKTLAACTATGVYNNTVESSIRCDDIGMTCMEFEREGVIFATCAYPAEDSREEISVTCQGSLARIQIENAYFTYDCAQLKAECRAGSYNSWDNYVFCETSRPDCDPEEMEPYCDGPTRVNWCNGGEIGFDCRQMDMECRQTQFLLWNMPMCTYPDIPCNSYSFQEECNNGVITFCGPEGVSTFDCKANGYAGCTLNTFFAHCRARD